MIREEVNPVIVGKKITYEGIFNYSDLIVMIDSFFKKRGFTKHVMRHKEKVGKKGKHVILKIRPFREKKKAKLEVQVLMEIDDMITVKKQVDGLDIMTNQGKISVEVNAYYITFVRGAWEAKPEYTFIKTIFEKFLFSGKSKDYEGWVSKDANDFLDEIMSFLNLNKYVF